MNAQQLKNAILQEAIEGRLVPQDPNDEPASVLLDKIRKEKAKLVKEGKLKKKDLVETPIGEDEIPFTIPQSWEWVKMSYLTTLITKGTTPRGGNVAYLDKGIGFLRAENVDGLDKLNLSNLKYIDKETNDGYLKRSILQENDVLITIAGTLGRTALVRKEDLPLNANQAISLCRFADIESTNLRYVLLALNAPVIQEQFRISRKVTAIPNLTLEIIADTLIPLPPLAEQKRIVEKIEELLPKVDEYGKAQESLDKLNEGLPERLKKSILQEAIEGRLVPQDPNDEPASVLLDKIRKEKAKLVKEGKLKKKDLDILTISEDEIKFALPTGWIWSKLSFITSLLDGEKRDGDYVCLDAKYLRGKSSGDFLSKGKFVKKGDNIILVDGENSGEVFTVPCDGYMGSTFKQLWASESMYLPYVLHFIRFYKDILRNSKKGAAIPHLNKEIFNNLVIGIPPLVEQHRIVAKIEKLLKEIDKIKMSSGGSHHRFIIDSKIS